MNISKILIMLVCATLIAAPVFAKKNKNGPVALVYKEKSQKKKKKVSPKEYEKIKKERAAFKESLKSCQVEIKPFIDGRQNKETIGSNFSKPLLIDEFDTWMTDVKTKLVDRKFKSIQSESAPVVLQPTITRLYTYAQNMNIHGVSALRVDVIREGEVAETLRYRGLGSRANMANGVGEYHNAANRAINDVVDVFYKDLPKICGVGSSS